MKLSILFAVWLKFTMIFGFQDERFLDRSIRAMDTIIDDVRDELEFEIKLDSI